MRTILIPADDALPICAIETKGLDSLQAAVGGTIEALPVPGIENATAYINEEGKIYNLPINFRASIVWAKNQLLWPGDRIHGNLIMTGLNPETGEQQPLPDTVMPDLPRATLNPETGGWIIDLPVS